MATQVVDNADTWLDFTDLLFIDPLGTGYSRLVGKDNEDAAKHFYSIDGDIDELSTVVRKWLVANDRLASLKFIVGESYGGFRAPKLARRLESKDGIAIDGIVMVSPVLDFAWFQSDSNPAIYAGHLPSLVAAAKGIGGNDAREKPAGGRKLRVGPLSDRSLSGAARPCGDPADEPDDRQFHRHGPEVRAAARRARRRVDPDAREGSRLRQDRIQLRCRGDGLRPESL